MKFTFNLITSLSLRFRWLTLALVVVFMGLGVQAASSLNQELLPPIEFPQTIVLGQVSGMTSDQVLTVVTERLEAEISQVEDVINLESTSSGTFGTLLTAANDFGLNQTKLQGEIRDAIDRVWFPGRRIEPTEGQNVEDFAATLLGDLTPELVLYLAANDSNFLFQLTPDVWNALPEETVQAAITYLAQQLDTDSVGTALERLVEKQIVPQIQAIDTVADVTISGGQSLPGEEDALAVSTDLVNSETQSLLLGISPDVWDVVSNKISGLGALNQSTVDSLSEATLEVPTEAPALPESWQFEHFADASDLLEIESIANPLSTILNDFLASGKIIGGLGQTNDLTPETVTQMLEIDPTLVDYFEAEHLVAMPADVFAVLPEDFIAGLDGFTRDALAAASLAQSITGKEVEAEPVDLPDAWRISVPDLITFNLATDFPLATFFVTSTGEGVEASEEAASSKDTEQPGTEETAPTPALEVQDIPEGPQLPGLFAGIGADTADDLINLELPESLVELVGTDTLSAAQILSFMATPLDMTGSGNSGGEAPAFSLDLLPFTVLMTAGPNIIPQMSAESFEFLIEYDPGFLPELSPAVFDLVSDEVLALSNVTPPLDDAWDVLSSQPQFLSNPLRTAGDILIIGDGSASSVLNTINRNVPVQFEGYEVRLLDSLAPAVIRYFLVEEPDFYSNLDSPVLLKFSADVLEMLPEDIIADLDDDIAEQIQAIATGEQNSAFAELQELYTSNIPEADPDAPALNPAWSQIAGFYGIEMDSADDFFRFPEGFAYPDAGTFINSIFLSPQGASFARNNNLLREMPIEALEYVINRDGSVLDSLIVESLQEMTDEQLALLPETLQTRATEGGEPFLPETQITRTNSQPSLFVSVFKTADANTVTSYKEVEELIFEAVDANDNIEVGVVIEQASFIEESINGVAREGSLGAVFAIIIILVFLSSGVWVLKGRQRVGAIMVVLFISMLLFLVYLNLDAANNDWGQAFTQSDVVVRVLFIGGILAGLVVLFWPSSLPDPAWRATVVIAVSIPLSILTAFVGMYWLSPVMYDIIQPMSEDSEFWAFILRLFPEELTLNIMTLSGLTVAVGRVVDDSIVVLENIFRQIQGGGDKKEAVLSGTRDVSSAIFVATLVAVVVFLPLGLTGGLIGAFFLPFGLAVTYSLAGSFIVAITVVPVLAYIMIDAEDVPEEGDIWIADYYLPVLRWALRNGQTKLTVIALAIVSFAFSFFLFSQRPAAFLPNFGEPQVSVDVRMPPSTKILQLNDLVLAMEERIVAKIPEEQLVTVQSNVGGGGANFESLLGGGGVNENQANITVALDVSEGELETWIQTLREEANTIFGETNVTVAQATGDGFGGLEIVVSGPSDVLAELDPIIIETLEAIEGIANVKSNLSASASDSGEGPVTYIRVGQQSALKYTGELETTNTIGITQLAKKEIQSIPDLSEGVSVSEGFTSQTQTEGFQSMFVAIMIASVIVILILILSFRSIVYWFAIFLSVIVAPVGAAIALTLTDRVLGISALIGLLMLLGLVVTNAVVLIDRVRSNLEERNMNLYDSLVEAGGRRLRPIIMTSLATIIALLPLAIGLSEGAIIASELGTVVIGGVFSSTVLTLIVVPVMYSLLNPVHRFLTQLVGVEAR